MITQPSPLVPSQVWANTPVNQALLLVPAVVNRYPAMIASAQAATARGSIPAWYQYRLLRFMSISAAGS